MSPEQPVLIYDRIDANRRQTLLLLVLFAIVMFPAVASITQYLMAFLMLVVMPSFSNLVSEKPVMGMILFAILALAMVLLAAYLQYRYASNLVLRIAGARPVGIDQEQDLWRTVENLCIGAGLPQPQLYVVESAAPNAFAAGLDPERASLVVTRGLLQLLDRRELEGVIAHELSHIGNNDIRLSTTVAALVGTLRLPFLIVAGFFRALFRINSTIGVVALLWLGMMFFLMLGAIFVILSEPSVEDSSRTILLLAVGLLIYVNFGAPFIGQLLRLVISRQREFLADADAALLTRNPEGLARALAKISATNSPPMKVGGATAHLYFTSPLSSDAPWWDRLFNSHPPIEERIDLLARMGSGMLPSVLQEAEEAGAKFKYTVSHGSEAKEAGEQFGNSSLHGVPAYDRIATNRLKTLLPLALFAFVLWSAASWLLTPFMSFPGSINAIIVIAIVVVASYLPYLYASNLVLWITGAYPVGKGNLWETVEKLRIDAGLPGPRVCVVESAAPNAFTVGLNPKRASLVVSRGLLQLLDQKELEGVLAHELSHIRNNDIRLSTTVAALSVTLRLILIVMGILLIFFSIFGKSFITYFPMELSVNEFLGPLYSSIGGTLIKGALAMWVSSLIIPKEQDYLADTGAARLTQNSQGLAQALGKISSPRNFSMKREGGMGPLDFAGPLSQDASWWDGLFRGATAHLSVVDPFPEDAPWWDRIFRTHPPIEDRIAQLAIPDMTIGAKI